MQSNLERIVTCSYICSAIGVRSAHLPLIGFAAAKIDVLEFNLVVIPALATLIVCCYMAS